MEERKEYVKKKNADLRLRLSLLNQNTPSRLHKKSHGGHKTKSKKRKTNKRKTNKRTAHKKKNKKTNKKQRRKTKKCKKLKKKQSRR